MTHTTAIRTRIIRHVVLLLSLTVWVPVLMLLPGCEDDHDSNTGGETVVQVTEQVPASQPAEESADPTPSEPEENTAVVITMPARTYVYVDAAQYLSTNGPGYEYGGLVFTNCDLFQAYLRMEHQEPFVVWVLTNCIDNAES